MRSENLYSGLQQNMQIDINQYHSWFYYKPPPYNFEMLKYLKKEEENLLKT